MHKAESKDLQTQPESQAMTLNIDHLQAQRNRQQPRQSVKATLKSISPFHSQNAYQAKPFTTLEFPAI